MANYSSIIFRELFGGTAGKLPDRGKWFDYQIGTATTNTLENTANGLHIASSAADSFARILMSRAEFAVPFKVKCGVKYADSGFDVMLTSPDIRDGLYPGSFIYGAWIVQVYSTETENKVYVSFLQSGVGH